MSFELKAKVQWKLVSANFDIHTSLSTRPTIKNYTYDARNFLREIEHHTGLETTMNVNTITR